jgi:hypothetical protein
MITRAVRIFEYFPAGDVLPLKPDETGKVELTRPTVACLVSLMFLCALPNNQMSFASLLYSQQSYQVRYTLLSVSWAFNSRIFLFSVAEYAKCHGPGADTKKMSQWQVAKVTFYINY